MANITQKINSYVHGMSMQPDHLKSPGQVRNLVNGLPDVMAGLVKRPGSEIISELETTADGRWFHISRDDQEKYVCKIDSTGISVWSLIDGTRRTVKYSSSSDIDNPTYINYKDLPYFYNTVTNTPANSNSIDPLTINDYTVLLNRDSIVRMSGERSPKQKNEAFVTINTLEYNTEYRIQIAEPDPGQSIEWRATGISISPTYWEWHNTEHSGYQAFTVDDIPNNKFNLGFAITVTNGVIGYQQYSVNPSVTLTNGGRGWLKGDKVRQGFNGATYDLTVTSAVESIGYTSLVDASYFTPKDSASGALKTRDILSALKSDLDRLPGIETTIIGNGIYIKYDRPFSVIASGGQTSYSMKSFMKSVNDVSDLPAQCKDGYVVKVSNSAEAEDDYYLKFVGESDGVDGSGSWEETVKPDTPVALDYNTMPHKLVRMSDGSFLVCPIDWEKRLVGDENTNPEPSFVGKAINKCLFYRNRLTFLSDENIIQSQSGDYFNFFVNTAMIVTDNDPIDLAATSTSPCELSDAVPMKIGLVLFSRDRQFLYGTTLDVLSPTTAKIETLSTYNWNEHLSVVDMGVTIGFASTAGKYSRFFELTNLESNNAPEALEQSKVVSELLPADIDTIAESKESTLLSFSKKGTSRVYMYRYFNDGAKRLLSSWFKWDITGNLYHHFIDKDRYYTVVSNAGNVFLAHHELSVLQEDYFVGQTGISYAPRLDLRFDVNKSGLSYDYKTDLTTFTTPFPVTNDLHVFVRESGRFEGRSAPVTSVTSGNVVAIKGDWSTTNLTIGYSFEFKVELPTIHYTKEASENKTRSDTRSYLTVHRVKFQLSDIGIFNLAVTARSKGTKNLVWEMSPADDYKANMHEVLPLVLQTVPCYEKNTNLDLVLTSDHPSPAVLLSMEWEGKLSTKYYTSV